jgi:predicted nucleic acid-binding protein
VIVADASVWVSHLVSADTHHATSRRWLTTAVREGTLIVAPALLLAEVAGAIARRTQEPNLGQQATGHILSYPNLRLVTINTALGLAAAQLAAERQVRGADAFYIAVAQQLSLPLFTWDREQSDRAAGVVAIFSLE